MRKQKEGCAPRGLAPPRPDPRHPEAVLATVARAAGIDVHKMSLTCTVLVEDASGRVASETRQYRTYGAELDLLVRWLADLDLARVVMESTGVFWKTVQRALAAAGVEVWVVNARHVKRVPGRKTDVSDSQWLATLARYGLVSPSFLAPPQLEELRRLTRLYARTRRLASMLRNMLHRMLDESGARGRRRGHRNLRRQHNGNGSRLPRRRRRGASAGLLTPCRRRPLGSSPSLLHVLMVQEGLA